MGEVLIIAGLAVLQMYGMGRALGEAGGVETNADLILCLAVSFLFWPLIIGFHK